jgi:putative hydrolase of the HAD superfamily
MAISQKQRDEILALRQDRMERALLHVDPMVLNTLADLKRKGKRLCLISNADVIDVVAWRLSALAKYFEQTIFSFEAGYLKPDERIYRMAMEAMKVSPARCLFVGDGGSQELCGAKNAGMKTVFTEYLECKDEEKRREILPFADYHITNFSEILGIVATNESPATNGQA